MRNVFIALFVAVACLSVNIEGKKLGRCEIVRELRQHGFPEDKLRNWVCLVENESSGRTVLKSKQNKNGSYDYGLFQINDKYWCTSSGPAGKDCHVTCADVNKDDITQASQCAKKIYQRHGFKAWYGWKNHCQGALPDISSC